jgi:hypothetical protein
VKSGCDVKPGGGDPGAGFAEASDAAAAAPAVAF